MLLTVPLLQKLSPNSKLAIIKNYTNYLSLPLSFLSPLFSDSLCLSFLSNQHLLPLLSQPLVFSFLTFSLLHVSFFFPSSSPSHWRSRSLVSLSLGWHREQTDTWEGCFVIQQVIPLWHGRRGGVRMGYREG